MAAAGRKIYDLRLEFGMDKVDTYFGMRKLTLTDKLMLINDKPIFQRLVLDQGYYPDGIYTAPSDEALKISNYHWRWDSTAQGCTKRYLKEGFVSRRQNGLYRLGRIWQLGLNHTKPEALEIFMPEWIEAVERDYNSPALLDGARLMKLGI